MIYTRALQVFTQADLETGSVNRANPPPGVLRATRRELESALPWISPDKRRPECLRRKEKNSPLHKMPDTSRFFRQADQPNQPLVCEPLPGFDPPAVAQGRHKTCP